MTIADLKRLIASLPDHMQIRFTASEADELQVCMAETYGVGPNSPAVLMLCDAGVDGPGAGATVIWDERE